MSVQGSAETGSGEPPTDPAPKSAPVPAIAPSDADLDANGWLLLRGPKQFGPMSGHELAGYFKSKMVVAGDTVTGPCWPEPVAAIEAATLLQVPAPPPAAVADTAQAAPGAIPPAIVLMEAQPAGLNTPMVGLWLAFLFAIQVAATATDHWRPVHSVQLLLLTSAMHYVVIGLLCFSIIVLPVKLLRGDMPNLVWPLLAMTMVYGALLSRNFLTPPPEPQSPPQQVATMQSSTPSLPDNSTAPVLPPDQPGENPTAPPTSFFAAPRAVNPFGREQPIDYGASTGHKDWYGFAKTLEQKRDWQGLLNLTLEWTASEPNTADAWNYQGIAYSGLRQEAQAVLAGQHALRIAPDRAYIWNNLAYSYLVLGNLADSESASRKALELDKGSAVAWNNLGAALQSEGKDDEAMADYQQAVAADSGYAMAWANVGNQFYRRRQFPEALDAFKKALALDPTNEIATTGIANVQEMQRLGGG